MKVAVYGLWHLGSVISACLPTKGHDVIGVDHDVDVLRKLSLGKAPLYEPGLDDLIQDGVLGGNLKFSKPSKHILQNSEVVWVAYDTPVDNEDIADVDFVFKKIKLILPLLAKNTLILISSQLPAGSVNDIEKYATENVANLKLRFACSPENLRLGQAINVFNNPDRLVVGIRCEDDKALLSELILPITKNIEWMSVESAEMTKHAINAFLATSISLTNEIASICETVGANAKEVERGLKTEARIGQKAYVSPGGAFAGGTLARDIEYLSSIGKKSGLINHVLLSVSQSNDEHKTWVRRKLLNHFGDISGKNIGVWGLTYKPGTDTLRRSASLETCDWILSMGGQINVYDPTVEILPKKWGKTAKRFSSPLEVVQCSDALIVATEWPDFKEIEIDFKALKRKEFAIFDANSFLKPLISNGASHYYSVGIPVVFGVDH